MQTRRGIARTSDIAMDASDIAMDMQWQVQRNKRDSDTRRETKVIATHAGRWDLQEGKLLAQVDQTQAL